jgi:hypothetical protein
MDTAGVAEVLVSAMQISPGLQYGAQTFQALRNRAATPLRSLDDDVLGQLLLQLR